MKEQTHYKVYVSSLINSAAKNCGYLRDVYNELKEYLGKELSIVKDTKDIWMRDYMPIQVNTKTFVTYRYRPDYLWNPHYYKYITSRFSTPTSIRQNEGMDKELPFYDSDVELRHCDLILDGGNIVICGDRIILTDKIFIENRPKSRKHIIGELRSAFDKEVIIIPSDPYEIRDLRLKDNPDKHELPLCHADGVIAPIDNDSILIADYGQDPLGYVPQLMNALSPYFKPENIKHFDFGEDWTEDVWVYINFLRIGDLILVPQLGGKFEKYDEEAINQLKRFFITDNVHGINTRILSLGEDKNGEKVNLDNCGGALHCITWEVKID